jgi:FecR protein
VRGLLSRKPHILLPVKINLLVFAATILLLSQQLHAGALKGATVNRVVNDVQVLPSHGKNRRVTEREIVGDDASLRVGARSRAEIIFADRTLARIGAETSLGLTSGKREMSLNRGTLLLQAPRFRGSTRIRVGRLTVECGSATILVEHLPGKSLKAVALEGEMRVFVPGILGDSVVVPAGKLLITSLEVKSIPDSVDTDLRTLVKTSALIDPVAFSGPGKAPAAPLPSLARIDREIARQEAAVTGKRLIRTNLVIMGSGTNVVIPPAVETTVAMDTGANVEENTAEGREVGNETRRGAEVASSLTAGPATFPEPPLPEP